VSGLVVRPHALLCDGCVDGAGYIWPIASNGNQDHDWVERCDSCERFESDLDAAYYIVQRLRAMGALFDCGVAPIPGVSGVQHWIDNVRSA